MKETYLVNKINLKIYSNKTTLSSVFMGDDSPDIGDVKKISDSVSVELSSESVRMGILESEAIFGFLFLFSSSVASSFIASWIYEKVKEEKVKIEIEGVEVSENTKEGIKKIIIASIKIK